jgi:amidase
MIDLWRLTATEVVRKLRKRELSPLELVEAAASRIEAVEPKINALSIRFFEEARDCAKRFKHESRDNPGWLAGLPMAVKDYNDVAGQLTTYGSPIFAEHHAPADDRTIATLRANSAGQIERTRIRRKPYLQSGLGYHAQSLEFGSHGWRLIGRRRSCTCGRRSLAR